MARYKALEVSRGVQLDGGVLYKYYVLLGLCSSLGSRQNLAFMSPVLRQDESAVMVLLNHIALPI
jgi:hypothetical protein